MDVEQYRRIVSSQLEIGYKGLIGSRLSAGVDVFVKHDDKIVSPSRLKAITPNVFYDEETLASYLSGFLPADSAAVLADSIAGIPVGTISPNEIGPSSELLFVFLQGGSTTFWGVDVTADAWLSDDWLVSAAYSWKSDNFFEDVGQVGDIILGVPEHMGLLRLEYRQARIGFSAGAQLRARSSFDMAVASWVGELEEFALLDLDLGYRPLWSPRVGFFLNATNVLDDRHVEVIGAKVLGRLVSARIQVDL
jgi:outer membrane receptor protein involved in Fe transport